MAPDRGSAKNTLRINNQALGTFRGGSLPNVSAGTLTAKAPAHIKDSVKVNFVTAVVVNIIELMCVLFLLHCFL